MNVADTLAKVKAELPTYVKLVAISKTQPVSRIMEAYAAGHRIFGENKVQELIDKHPRMPLDVEWHMVGHLQTNKVKFIAPFVSLIHSVDSLKLLGVINREAAKCNRVIPCLLQVYIAEEETKYGLSRPEIDDLLSSSEYAQLENVRVAGLMGMASFTQNMDQVRNEFRNLRTIFEAIRLHFFLRKPFFSELSMGMSDDYRVAVEEGSTIVRIGSNIFGRRPNA